MIKFKSGRFKNVKAVIKNITLDEHGQPNPTNKGEKKLSLAESQTYTGTKTPKQILLEVKNRKKLDFHPRDYIAFIVQWKKQK